MQQICFGYGPEFMFAQYLHNEDLEPIPYHTESEPDTHFAWNHRILNGFRLTGTSKWGIAECQGKLADVKKQIPAKYHAQISWKKALKPPPVYILNGETIVAEVAKNSNKRVKQWAKGDALPEKQHKKTETRPPKLPKQSRYSIINIDMRREAPLQETPGFSSRKEALEYLKTNPPKLPRNVHLTSHYSKLSKADNLLVHENGAKVYEYVGIHGYTKMAYNRTAAVGHRDHIKKELGKVEILELRPTQVASEVAAKKLDLVAHDASLIQCQAAIAQTNDYVLME